MKLLLCLLLSLFCISCCSSLVLIHPSSRQLAAQEADETVALVYMDGNEEHLYCSGVFVSNSVLMTANHCIVGLTNHINNQHDDGTDDNLFPEVKPNDVVVQFAMVNEITEVGKQTSAIHSATVKALYHSIDVALLDITNPNSLPNHGIVRIAKDTPKRGDHLSFMGHPDGFYYSYLEGVVANNLSDLKYVPTMGPFIQVSAPVYKGNSGGCAFNDIGDCVGIASFLNSSAPNMAFYISTETIRGVLIGNGIIKADLISKLTDPRL